MTASALLYAIAALLITAAIGGMGWLIKDYLRIHADEGEKDHRIAREQETAKRVSQDGKDAQEARQEVANMSDAAVNDFVRDKLTRPKR